MALCRPGSGADVRSRAIGDMDVVIASVAVARGWGVATRNPRHFERIEGLAVADWTVAPP